MTRPVLLRIAALLLSALAMAPAQEPPARVRASIRAGPEPAWTGQRVVLEIDLLAPGYFAGTPRFDFPQIPGVLLIPPEGHPILGTEQIDGQSYAVQGYEAFLIAREEGVHGVPSFRIRFDIKRSPLDREEVSQEVSTPPVAFAVRRPPGARGGSSPVSSRDLAVAESWQPASLKGKVGDAFTRTITVTASDLPGMAFPPFSAAPVEGMSLYPREPDVSDGADRGSPGGRRRDTVVYVCERPGRLVVPAARLTWWNVDDRSFHTVDFPERVLRVVGNPALPGAGIGESLRRLLARGLGMWTCVLLGTVAAAAAWLFLPARIRARVVRPLFPVHLAPLNPIPRERPPPERKREGERV